MSNVIKKRKSWRLKINIFSGVAAMGVSNLCQLILAPIMLSYLGLETYGLWATLASILVIGQLGDQGLGDSLIRHVSFAHAKVDFLAVEHYVSTALVLSLGFGCVTALLLAGCHGPILQFMSIDEKVLLQATHLFFALIGLLFLFLTEIVINATLTGLGRIDLKNGILATARIIQFAVTVGLLIVGCGIWAVFFGQLVLRLIHISAATYCVRKLAGRVIQPFRSFRWETAKEMARMGSYMVLSRILLIWHQPLMRIILSRYLGLDYVAYFDIATKAIRVVKSLVTAGIKAVVPRVSAADHEGLEGVRIVNRIMTKLTLGVLLSLAPLYVLLFLFGGNALEFWIRDAYQLEMLTALRYLLPASFANILVVPAYYVFIGWGRTDICAILAGATIVVFLLGVGIVKHMGAIANFQCTLLVYGLSFFIPALFVPPIYFWIHKNRILKLSTI